MLLMTQVCDIYQTDGHVACMPDIRPPVQVFLGNTDVDIKGGPGANDMTYSSFQQPVCCSHSAQICTG